ncbi:MAG: tol-pal system protein YbgF [Lentisphaerae bacterium ADurb.BinA184]|nr:MAG: tol-pal system protein YbgF [Lentisphaerae bacterium ADurb.BinA184]
MRQEHPRSTDRSWPRLAGLGLLVAALLAAAAPAAEDNRRADELFETAMAAYKLERWEDAGNKFYDFMAAAPHDPRNDQAQYYAARTFLLRNYLNRAIEEFGYLIEDFPDSQFTTLGYHDRSACHRQTRQVEPAVADAEQVIRRPVKIYHGEEDALLRQLYENHRADVFWLAKHYLERKETDLAVAAYRRLPYEMEAFRNVVDVYYGLGDFARIQELIDGLQASNRHEGFKYLIEFYAKRGAVNQLKGIFERLLQEKEPTDATDDLVWHTGGQFWNIGREQWEWAMRRISSHYPRRARRADYELARHSWENPAFLDELELFVIKYRSGNDVDDVLRWKGITLERQGQPEAARKDYRRLGNTALGHWFAAESYHGQYAREKDLKGGLAEYMELRKAFYSPEWAAMAQWRIGGLHRALKEVEPAVEAYRQMVKRFGTLTITRDSGPYYHWQKAFFGVEAMAYGPAAQLAAGDTLREARRFEDAEMEYRLVVTNYGKSDEAPTAAYRIALCYEGLEDKETAIKVMKSVLRRYPKSPAASEAHTRLETQYGIPDTEVTDAVDFFTDVEAARKGKNYIEDPAKMKRKP